MTFNWKKTFPFIHLKTGKRCSAKKWLHAEAEFENSIFLKIDIWGNDNKVKNAYNGDISELYVAQHL